MKKVGIIKLKIVEKQGNNLVLRENNKLLKLLIHELCHLTEKGNYPLGKTPEEIHKKFDKIAERLLT